MCDGPDLFLIVLSILFPPIGVWVKRGICSADSMINICLCVLGFLPGLFHAWYIISKYPDPGYEPVQNEENVVYYIHAAPGSQGYGTVTPHGQFPGQHTGTANAFPQKQSGRGKKPTYAKVAAQPQPHATSSNATPVQGAEGAAANSSNPDAPPPSYADALKGDHKVQTD